jgi:hypothetical protein
MKKERDYSRIAFSAFCSFSLCIVLFTMNSCSSKASQSKSIEIGEIITLYKTPYLNDHTMIYNPNEQKWHLYGIDDPQTSFIHLTADSLTQQG